jgi:hypothetical protein
MRDRHFVESKAYQELDWAGDRALVDRVRACVETQKRAARSVFESAFKPDRAAASAAVAEEALRPLLKTGRDVHGIASERSISNVIVFNAKHIDGAVQSEEAREARAAVDEAVFAKIRELLPRERTLSESGYFWYPPGAYMSWHTNSGAPGLRLYVSYSEEPGKSFFRYRDPATERIVTSMDDGLNVRLFAVRADRPLWHAIYSDTHRFSLGYLIRPRRLRHTIKRTIKRWLKP